MRFDDQAVADFFDQQVDAGLPPQRFARIWMHTHPGKSALPSNTDEDTFRRCFGGSDWSLMFILARGGQTYARLRFNAGPSGELVLPVEIDFSQPFEASDGFAWQEEYQRAVQEEQLVTWQPRSERRLNSVRSFLEPEDLIGSKDHSLDAPLWDDQSVYSFLESIDDSHRHPF